MLSTQLRVDRHGEFSEDGCRWVRYSGRVISFQCRRNDQTATHRQQAFFNVPEVKQLWMMLTFLMPPSPQSPSMLPQQHRHLDNCSTSSVEAMTLQAPSSHIPSQTSPTTSGVQRWNMDDEFHASKAISCLMLCALPTSLGALPYRNGPHHILGPTQMLQCSPFLTTLMMQENSWNSNWGILAVRNQWTNGWRRWIVSNCTSNSHWFSSHIPMPKWRLLWAEC